MNGRGLTPAMYDTLYAVEYWPAHCDAGPGYGRTVTCDALIRRGLIVWTLGHYELTPSGREAIAARKVQP